MEAHALAVAEIAVRFFGRYGRIRSIIRRAVLNGYALGEYCQGGGYAVRRSTLDSFASNGLFLDPLLWIYTPCGEDVTVSLYARAVGFVMQDFNAEGEPFGVRYQGLADNPEGLLARRYSIIHSVKDHDKYREDETRRFFREIRVLRGGESAMAHELLQ